MASWTALEASWAVSGWSWAVSCSMWGGARGGFLGHLEATESPNDENSNIPQTVRQINVLASWASLGRALVSFFWGEGGRSWKPFGPCGRHIGPSWRQPLTAWEGSPRRYGSFGELEGCAWPSRMFPGAEVAQSQLRFSRRGGGGGDPWKITEIFRGSPCIFPSLNVPQARWRIIRSGGECAESATDNKFSVLAVCARKSRAPHAQFLRCRRNWRARAFARQRAPRARQARISSTSLWPTL